MRVKMLNYLILGLFAIALFVYGLSDFIIFQPPRPSSYQDSKNIIKLKTSDGAIISAIYLPNEKAKYTLLVSHGNAEDLGTLYPFLLALKNHGFSVFAYDYHGYGTSSGKPSEKRASIDIDAAYDYLINTLKISPNHIILYGRSLGAAVALDLASRQQSIAGLILESPFVSAFRVMTVIPIFPFDKFNNLTKINKIYCPVLIMHGRKDFIVPFWHGKKLYEKANQPKYFLWVDNAGHNDVAIIAGDKYWKALEKFNSSL
jgi:fermentation-respiration switch protein FrsA (DUF1100 family)